MVSFSDEAIKVYEYAHPTCMQMFISSNKLIVVEKKEFVHDSVWRKIAHPSARNKKVASISEIDFLKVIQLDLDCDTITIKVRNNLESIEPSFKLMINDSKLPSVLDSLRQIGYLPTTRLIIFHFTTTDETIYQNFITLFDQFLLSKDRFPYYTERVAIGVGTESIYRVYSKLKIVRSKDPAKDSSKEHIPFNCHLKFIQSVDTTQKPSITSIFMDYLNPFGKDILHIERWWLTN